MIKTIDAIYEGGVLRPLEPLVLPESQRVTITLTDAVNDDWMDVEFMDACGAESDPSITLVQVRHALAKIRGSMDEALNEDRGEF